MPYTGFVVEIMDNGVIFRTDDNRHKNLVTFERINYLSIKNDVIIRDGVILVPEIKEKADAAKVQRIPNTWSTQSKKSFFESAELSKIGGVCIGLAGALQYSIYYDTQKIIEGDLKYDQEKENNKGKLASILFIIGGVCIALDQ